MNPHVAWMRYTCTCIHSLTYTHTYNVMYIHTHTHTLIHTHTHTHTHHTKEYEYEEDFDEVLEEEETASSQSEGEGRSTTPTERSGGQIAPYSQVQNQQKNQHVDLLAIMHAIDAENMAVETSSQSSSIEPSFENVDGTVIVKFVPPQESDREGGSTEGGTETGTKGGFEKLQSPSRKFVDFSHAQKNEASLRVAKKTRKRAQVRCVYVPVSYTHLTLPTNREV